MCCFKPNAENALKPEKQVRALNVLARLPVETDFLPISGMTQVLHLCRAHGLTAYDALYLELALRRNIPLATQDKSLKNSALAAGAKVFS